MNSSDESYIANQLLTRLPGYSKLTESKFSGDPCLWAEKHFYIPETGKPIELEAHQKAVIKAALTPKNRKKFPYRNVIFSTIKKSGKTAIAGLVVRWMAEFHAPHGEIYCTGNDQEQAKGRAFKAAKTSIELDPDFVKGAAGSGTLPGQWETQKTIMRCISSGAEVKAISVDYRGEAGGNPTLTVWTELWGYDHEDSKLFFDEMTQSPVLPVSIRFIETYAGFDGESDLLQDWYETGKEGRQLTAGELAEMSGEPLGVFKEAPNPDSLVPVWVDEFASLFMYWDEDDIARRMPWQQGEEGEAYYREQEENLPPAQFERFHRNKWSSAESSFVPIQWWDDCAENLPAIENAETGKVSMVPLILGLDAATRHDCFAVLAVTRHPDPERWNTDIAVRAVRIWTPPKDGEINYEEVEQWLRQLCSVFNVKHIAYDEYQLVEMMQRFAREQVAWVEAFSQQQERRKADRRLYDLIAQRRVAWDPRMPGADELRQHIINANVKLQKDEDSTMKIIKKKSGKPIDAVVALSMAATKCLYLNLTVYEERG